jgi:hypothetical protein
MVATQMRSVVLANRVPSDPPVWNLYIKTGL